MMIRRFFVRTAILASEWCLRAARRAEVIHAADTDQPTAVTFVTRTPSAFRDQFKTCHDVRRPYVEGPPGWRSR